MLRVSRAFREFTGKVVEICKENQDIKTENAKLKELVKNLHTCNDSCPRCIELMGKCEYEEQLREFGIGVDE